MKSKYIYEYFMFDSEDIVKHKNKWLVFEESQQEVVAKIDYYSRLNQVDFTKYKKPILAKMDVVGAGLYLPVTLYYKKKNISLLMIPDSGASISVLSGELADYLSIDLDKCRKSVAFAGTGAWQSSAYETEISFRVGSDNNLVKTTVHIIKDQKTPLLLGQMGFFENYEVCFSPEYAIKYRYVGQ